ncbi:LysR substrate-binding domain-containing protein [Grimontia sp. NTOU-MAR1]|uniref:LysR substrate-binding domain-containing protein n=1 Tax=Grimontia sp. NTOU-MAR1 TaxID=3111011 RepID=UPI002DB9E566|nr:LysR substrate-binding domain-containing protein [Grimontia sp. NTOU-MAR1]WRV97793.1 LysR substrate-binding domain-containing protein [Grimontia sp. NTOU-MAR1]
MKKRLPPLNWLRSFEAAARHLSFTHASQELHITQAAMSQQIKALESQLGAVLFVRLPRGLELTEAGAAYLPVLHESIEKMNEVTEELFGKGRNKLLNVKVNLVFFVNWLAPRLSRFYAQNPNINLKITSNIWVNSQEKSSDCDLEVIYGNGRWQQYEARRLTWDLLQPVCSPHYAKRFETKPLPDQIVTENLIHVIGYEDGWNHWFQSIGMPYTDFSLGSQFDTLVNAFEVAANDGGIALGRSSLLQRYVKEKRLISLFEQKVLTTEAFYLVNHKSRFLHPHAEAFISWVMEEVNNDEINKVNRPLYN